VNRGRFPGPRRATARKGTCRRNTRARDGRSTAADLRRPVPAPARHPRWPLRRALAPGGGRGGRARPELIIRSSGRMVGGADRAWMSSPSGSSDLPVTIRGGKPRLRQILPAFPRATTSSGVAVLSLLRQVGSSRRSSTGRAKVGRDHRVPRPEITSNPAGPTRDIGPPGSCKKTLRGDGWDHGRLRSRRCGGPGKVKGRDRADLKQGRTERWQAAVDSGRPAPTSAAVSPLLRLEVLTRQGGRRSGGPKTARPDSP